LSGPGWAQSLTLPAGAELTQSQTPGLSRIDLATGPWSDAGLPQRAFEGDVTRRAFRIGSQVPTMAVLAALRAQLQEQEYDILFECDTRACGGFDFRFALSVLLPPAMQVDLSDFRYLSASNGGHAAEVLVSRAGDAAYVQITQIGPQVAVAPTAVLRGQTNLAQALDQSGRFVLSSLIFDTGAAQLGAGPFEALQELADYLVANPGVRVALVGHTDSSGSLEANIALSRRRAASVLDRMVRVYGVDRQQLDAQGVGYLAPIASNQTEEGREANRRVEVVVTSAP